MSDNQSGLEQEERPSGAAAGAGPTGEPEGPVEPPVEPPVEAGAPWHQRLRAVWDGGWARGLLSLLVCGLACWYFASKVGQVYPVREWLFWSIAPLWCWTALLSLSWVSIGALALERIYPRRSLPLLETGVLSAALGSVLFVLIMYLAGALRLFRPWFAVLLPLALIAAGHRPLLDLWRRTREVEAADRTPVRRWLLGLVIGWGAFSTAMVYLQLLTPDTINFDAAWCHLTVAQDYAREGRIVAFPADYARNHPHLASLVHTWGFLVPGLSAPQRWMLAIHDEFAVMLWSLAGVSAAARWMLDDRRAPGLWVAFFLFPNIFVYDSNIGGAADHYLAFYAAPLFLAAVRAAPGLSARAWGLFGVFAAGALLTKYQAVYMIAGVGAVLGVAWLRHAWAAHRAGELKASLKPLLFAPIAAGAALVLVSSPHFVRNLVFYANPFYPFAQTAFKGTHPTVPNGPFLVEWVFKDKRWTPTGPLPSRLVDTLKTTFNFSFEPHYSFTKNVPSFGSLFTLFLPFLPLFRRGKRAWVGAAAGFLCVFLWALTFRVDRNLQAFVPLMAAFTAAAIVKTAELGWLGVAAASALVSLQVVWGGDAMFFSGHGRLTSAVDLIRSGFEGNRGPSRLDYRKSFTDVTAATPRNARILLHDFSQSLGIDRELYTDYPGHQGLISYDAISSPRALYDYYQKLGFTHVLNYTGAGYPTVQGEIMFSDLLRDGLTKGRRFGGYDLHEFSRPPAPPSRPYKVLVLGGISGYAPGLYPVEALKTVEPLPDDKRRYAAPEVPLPSQPAQQRDLVNQADAIVFHGARSPLTGEAQAAADADFVAGQTFSGQQIKLRKRK